MATDPKTLDSEAITDDDNPELTEADFAAGRPFAEMHPALAASLKNQGGRPRVEQPKIHMGFRFAADVANAVKASGKGYTGRVEAILRDAISRGLL